VSIAAIAVVAVVVDLMIFIIVLETVINVKVVETSVQLLIDCSE
jgi:hypothetical protein